MHQDADKLIKSSLRRYKDNNDQKIRNAHLSVTAGQYIYLEWQPMPAFAAQPLANETYTKLMRPKAGLSSLIEVSATTLTINEDGISNTVSIKRATLAPSVKLAE